MLPKNRGPVQQVDSFARSEPCRVFRFYWTFFRRSSQDLHTKFNCLATNCKAPRLRILRGPWWLVRSFGRTKLQSRRCAFRLYIRRNTWPAWICHPALSCCDRVSKLRCMPTEVVHSTLLTSSKVHALSFYCLVPRLTPKLTVLPDRGSRIWCAVLSGLDRQAISISFGFVQPLPLLVHSAHPNATCSYPSTPCTFLVS
jgi:hypothetical protein